MKEKQNTDGWIKDAFENATPRIEGRTIGEFSSHMFRMFSVAFPSTMASYELAFGADKAKAIMTLLLGHPDLMTAFQCFFTAGYKAKIDELNNEKKGGNDNA